MGKGGGRCGNVDFFFLLVLVLVRFGVGVIVILQRRDSVMWRPYFSERSENFVDDVPSRLDEVCAFCFSSSQVLH